MPFEFFNPHKCVISCTLPAPHGQVKVSPGEYVPTPEQEAQGLRANLLRPHVSQSFLHKTPGHIRRRLRLESEQKAAPVEAQTPTAIADAVAAEPVAAPKLVDTPPVVAGDVQEQREPAPVAAAQESSAPAGDAAPAPSGAPSDLGEGAPVAPEESVKKQFDEFAGGFSPLHGAKPASPAAPPPETPPAAAVPPSAPLTPPSRVSPRKLEEEGTMSTAAATRELEEFVDRKCSSAGAKEGKRLR